MTDAQEATNVPEFPLTEEEIARLEKEAEERKAAAPVVEAKEPAKRKFYSIGIMTQVNKKINLRVFYDENKAQRFFKQALSIGVLTKWFFTKDVAEEDDMIKTFRELETYNPKKAGKIEIDANPADTAENDPEMPAPAPAFAPGMTVKGSGIPEGTKIVEASSDQTSSQ